MRQPYDRITEAYHDDMGINFGEKVRERVHWICSQAKGDNILDIGCSQGIVPILLGREGKKVLGIDLIDDAIQYAKNSLDEESETTKKYVEFVAANFTDYDFGHMKYDSIILSEVLEHLTDPARFLEKAASLLKENGQVIITVPFGIINHFDHKKTYYLIELINMLEKHFYVENINYFGKWTGIVAKLAGNIFEVDRNVVLKLENLFFEIENGLNNEIEVNKNKFNSLEKRFKEKEQEIASLKNSNLEMSDNNKKHINDLKKELLQHIESEEKALISYRVLINKYNVLKNSKLCRLTLWYWDIRKKMKK